MARVVIARPTLAAEGFSAEFALARVTSSPAHADVVVELRPEPALRAATLRSAPSFVALCDLGRLADYLEGHLVRLARGEAPASVFVPLELGFQVEALSGEVEADGEGEFTLRVMVSMGRSEERGTSVYAGCEGLVDASRARAFAAALRDARVAFEV